VVQKSDTKCFFQLRQRRRIQRSLDDDSIATLVHAFVASRVDYCDGLLAGAPKTDKLQHIQAQHRCTSHIEPRQVGYDRGLTGLTENDGPSKLQGMKLQDMKMTDKNDGRARSFRVLTEIALQ